MWQVGLAAAQHLLSRFSSPFFRVKFLSEYGLWLNMDKILFQMPSHGSTDFAHMFSFTKKQLRTLIFEGLKKMYFPRFLLARMGAKSA
jgi:hypothetical protein